MEQSRACPLDDLADDQIADAVLAANFLRHRFDTGEWFAVRDGSRLSRGVAILDTIGALVVDVHPCSSPNLYRGYFWVLQVRRLLGGKAGDR